jgi:hypothetical protein
MKIADIEDNLDLTRIAQPTETDHARLERYRRVLARLREEPGSEGEDRTGGGRT